MLAVECAPFLRVQCKLELHQYSCRTNPPSQLQLRRIRDSGVVFDGTVVVVNAEGAKPVMRAVTTACAGLNQVSGVGVKL